MAENPIKYSDLVQPDSSISDLIAQLEQLNSTYSETLKSLKDDAASLKTGLTGVSGATAQHREKIKESTVEADKLAKAQSDLQKSYMENAKQLASLKAMQQEQNNINKLTAKMNLAVKGSYDELSAKYSLIKIRLNGMSQEQRSATESGRALVAESNAIYQKMKELQAETGKTTLNVGNYEQATVSLKQELKNITAEMARMKLAGEDNSKAYRDMIQRAGDLKDAMTDAKNEIKNAASDTSTLDSVLSTAGAASGGFSVVTGSMELFGASSKSTEEAQKALQSTIAITTGIQAVQNAVQKDSAMMMGVSKIQSYALSKAEAYRRLISIQGTAATVGATVAQRIFNAVAAANPYVLLAMALITVVGALLLFSSGAKSASEKQKELNDLQKNYIELLGIESDRLQQQGKDRVEQLEKELSLAKARNASNSEIGKIEAELMAQKKKNHAQMVGFYGQEIDDLDKNREKLIEYKKELIRLKDAKAMGESKVKVDLELNGNITKAKVDDAIEAIQGKIDNYGSVIEIATQIKTEGNDLDVQAAEQREKQIQQWKDAKKQEIDLTRKAEDVKISLIENGFAQQKAQINANYQRSVADLKWQLANDKNLTAKGRQEINNTIVLLAKKKDQDLRDLSIKMSAEDRAALRNSQDLELAAMKEGYAKRFEQVNLEYTRQIEDIKVRLATERGLTKAQREQLNQDIITLEKAQGQAILSLKADINIEQLNLEKEAIDMRLQATQEGSEEEIRLTLQSLEKQRQIELANNAKLPAELKQNEVDINKKWDAVILKQSMDMHQRRAMMLYDQQASLEQSEFDLLMKSESQKTKYKLEAERERLKKLLELQKSGQIKMTDQEVKTMQNTIAKLDQEITKIDNGKGKDIYDLFGLSLDDDAKEAINTSVDYAMQAVNTFVQAKIDAADKAVDAANKEVDASQKKLDAEVEARSNGYASNVTMAQKELELSKKNQEKALKEKEKWSKAQRAIDTITQTSSLITASAQIWASLSGIPIIGTGLAIAALAVMWGSFAYSKIQAAQATKQSYGEGGLEILQGGSHASGNDIPIGMTPDGKDRRAEGGEAMAIINKKNTRRYAKLLPGLIDSLNKGTFERKYGKAFEIGGMSLSFVNNGSDLRDLENNVKEIREQGERRYYVDGSGKTIMVYKNLRIVYGN